MELAVLIPFVLVMSGVAVVMALTERQVPVSASAALLAAGKARRPAKSPLRKADAGMAEDVKITELPDETPSKAAAEGSERKMESTFSKTDVLLADALTEMIGLKAELYYLRGKIDSLNAEVARLSGTLLRPVPPNASAKKPVPLRKAA